MSLRAYAIRKSGLYFRPSTYSHAQRRVEELFGPDETLHATFTTLRDELLRSIPRTAGRLGELRLDTDLDVAHGAVRYLELVKVAALIDLVSRGEREGALFYKVLKWGSHSEEVIDVYSAIEHHERSDLKISPSYTVDGVIARLEGVLVRECEKGGTAASIKAAMDRAIDQLHAETGGARDAVGRTANKLRERLGDL